MSNTPRFTRSSDGIFAGVCKGLADALGADVAVVRIIWIVAFFIAGFGGLLYIALAFALPRRDRVEQGNQDKILGVCLALSKRFDMEVGLVRLFALFSLCLSLGGTVLGYFVLYFVLPAEDRKEKPVNSPDGFNQNKI